MIYAFAGRKLAVTDEMISYAEKRFGHLERLMGSAKMEPRLSAEFEFHQGENVKYVVRATLDAGGAPLHTESSSQTLHEAIDAAAKALAAEAERGKDKRLSFARRQAAKLKDLLRGLRNG